MHASNPNAAEEYWLHLNNTQPPRSAELRWRGAMRRTPTPNRSRSRSRRRRSSGVGAAILADFHAQDARSDSVDARSPARLSEVTRRAQEALAQRRGASFGAVSSFDAATPLLKPRDVRARSEERRSRLEDRFRGEGSWVGARRPLAEELASLWEGVETVRRQAQAEQTALREVVAQAMQEMKVGVARALARCEKRTDATRRDLAELRDEYVDGSGTLANIMDEQQHETSRALAFLTAANTTRAVAEGNLLDAFETLRASNSPGHAVSGPEHGEAPSAEVPRRAGACAECAARANEVSDLQKQVATLCATVEELQRGLGTMQKDVVVGDLVKMGAYCARLEAEMAARGATAKLDRSFDSGVGFGTPQPISREPRTRGSITPAARRALQQTRTVPLSAASSLHAEAPQYPSPLASPLASEDEGRDGASDAGETASATASLKTSELHRDERFQILIEKATHALLGMDTQG